MKRKGFLKNIIGALCVGVLMSMPVAANAAEKEDVVGAWQCSMGTFIFYNDGWVKHEYVGGGHDYSYYTMGSGTLTIEGELGWTSSGEKVYVDTEPETVEYDLWKHFRENATPDSDGSSVTCIYKVEGAESMEVWNVSYHNGKWYGTSVSPATMTRVQQNNSNNPPTEEEASSKRYEHEHSYEWTITTEPTETADGESSYVCTFCGDIKARQPVSADVVIREKLLASIKNAGAGTTVTFNNKSWLCYPQYVLDTLKEKGDVSLKTDFTYNGINYSFTIPAGSDYTNLEQADFYGFMYLYGAYNGTIVE